ncbi:ABI gene family member 3-like [Leptodactylus fuscus]
MADLKNKTPDVSTSRHEMEDIYREVSTARQALRDSYQNLQNVADYCEKNYMEAPDKRKALESTMSLVTQTLASVACQVGVAARHVSDLLEVQSLMLQKEEVKVRYISQLLEIHVEKVARQKIGKLTTSKKFQHTQKIQNGQNNRRLASYTRMPINFTSLDNTGHGFMDSDSQLSRTGTMSRKISVKNMGQTQSTLGRSSRSREPIAPPMVPAEKFPCPVTPGTTFPSPPHPARMNGETPLSTPEGSAPSLLLTQQSLDTDSPSLNSKFLEDTDECLPPPPPPDIDNEEKHSLWPIGNGMVLEL